MHARGPVVVVLDGRKRGDRNQLRQPDLDAGKLVHGLLPRLESGFLLLLDQAADQQVARKPVPLTQADRVDGGKPGKKPLPAR